MLKIVTNLLENLIISIDMTKKNEVIGRNVFNWKFRKLKKLAKYKNHANLFKFYNICITNIRALDFLVFETKIAFIELKQAFTKTLTL